MPTSQPGVINYVGECDPSTYLCEECEGDCDSDSDCVGDLVCRQRSGNEAVSGCTGEGGSRDVYGKDICMQTEVTTDFVQYVGNPCTDENGVAGSCEVCTGDCDQDADCKDSLRCAQRSGFDEDVPGCVWEDTARFDGSDFCKYLVLRFILVYCCVYS